MKLHQFLLPGLLLLAGAAQAQNTFSIGPVLGGNLATQHIAADNAPSLHYHLDWLAGAQANLSWGKFAVQPALLLSQKGYKHDVDIYYRDGQNLPTGPVTIHHNLRLSYLTLPVNFAYAPLGAKTGPQLFAGPYVSVLLGGRDVHTDTSNLPTDATVTDRLLVAESIDINSGHTGFRRFDAGLQGGVGYRYEAFLLQASYSLGLRTTIPTYTDNGAPPTDANFYNRAFQLSLAYLFGGAK
ncbi:porin family protein [Hymenobacter sp. BRD67]|uniref:porin family protein n=1 Tax=Hymenobacter sp. BRD67 TaxID=2675877 RepID=UPI001564A80E|nr:porin family protein [Hymenobacter sp. BRD67]QKG52378.1 PorT family protein [Hymenobacter sp. BRD67]